MSRKDKKYEEDDAEKAEEEDDDEDRDYKKSKETGRSEKGYERDDAEKAERDDEEEDADYDRGRGERRDAREDDEEAGRDERQLEGDRSGDRWDGAQQQGGQSPEEYDLDEDRRQALAALDQRYALRTDSEGILARLDALEKKVGAMNGQAPETTPESYVIPLDDDLNSNIGK